MPKTKKPRVCEVLGVEVGQYWGIGQDETQFRVNTDGTIESYYKGQGGWEPYAVSTMVLCEIINGEYEIKRKPRWTAEDKELAGVIKRLFPGMESIYRGVDGDDCLYIHGNNRVYCIDYRINNECFSALKDGESVSLDEILEAEQ